MKDYYPKNFPYHIEIVDFLYSSDGKEPPITEVRMWRPSFTKLMTNIPLNEDDMYVGLACHYHVDAPWEDISPDPWEIDDLPLALEQMKISRGVEKLKNKKSGDSEYEAFIFDVYEAVIELLEKAIAEDGTVYIAYDV